jgi:hypothetical protein
MLVFTNVSEKPAASIFRVDDEDSMFRKNIGEFVLDYAVSIEGFHCFPWPVQADPRIVP